MNAPPDQGFLLYRRGKELLESRLEQAEGPTAAARLIADAFRALWPAARFCYCRLKCGETLAARALDGTGAERPGWALALEEPIARWLDTTSSDDSDTLPAPPQTGLADPLRVARIRFRDTLLGAVGILFPADFSPQQETMASAAIEELCSYLGVRLYAEECRERQRAALQACEQQTPFCILADLVSPVSRELQNVFNNIVLQAAILKREVTAEVCPEVEVIRWLGLEASQMLNCLDDYRYRIAVPLRPLDLNRVATATLAELPTVPGVTVGLDLAPSLPPVAGSENEVRRLLRLLVNNAGSVLQQHGGGTVTVRTGARGNKVLLCVEDDGPAVEDDAGKVLDPFVLARAGENSLELGACQGLARKLKARIRADNRAPSGVVVTAEFDGA